LLHIQNKNLVLQVNAVGQPAVPSSLAIAFGGNAGGNGGG